MMSDDLRTKILEALYTSGVTLWPGSGPAITDAVLAVVQPELDRRMAPYRCCVHCPDDPTYHAENPKDSHDTWCTLCGDPVALLDRAERAERDRDKARAALARVEALAQKWRSGYGYEDDSTLVEQTCADRVLAALRTPDGGSDD
jgi:hypothetical protein